MNKYLAFKELRRELATAYEKELKAIATADGKSDLLVKIGQLELDFADVDSQLAGSEARKILHEEMRGTLQNLLKRYDRNLRGEAVGLGLELRGIAAATAVHDGLSDPLSDKSLKDEASTVSTAVERRGPQTPEAPGSDMERFASELGGAAPGLPNTEVVASDVSPVVPADQAGGAALPSLDELDQLSTAGPDGSSVDGNAGSVPDVVPGSDLGSVPGSVPGPEPMSANATPEAMPSSQEPTPEVKGDGSAARLDPFESLIKNIEEEYAAKTRQG